jgi:hypothetical protein
LKYLVGFSSNAAGVRKMSKPLDETKKKKDDEELPPPWAQIQTAIWLVGLAVLAWQDWWWPGILVLVAISGLTQAALRGMISRRETAKQQAFEETRLAREQADWLPDLCPNCGGPLSVSSVRSRRFCGE